MEEYKITGLSCANCAREMEEEIRKLDHGSEAKLLFNSGKLRVSKKINLVAVKYILAKDGASLVDNPSHGHDHDHNHGTIKLYLIGSSVLFLIAWLIDLNVQTSWAIPIYIVAMGLSGYQTFVKGIKNLTRLKFNIETLMTIALIGAVSIGEWKEATVVAILFGLNEYLEGLGMDQARKSMEKLLQVAPKEATLLKDRDEEVTVTIDSLNIGDIVLVRSGEKIPSDGKVVGGRSSVNEAVITGESLPVEKNTEDPVFGGSINNEGILKIEIEKEYKDSSLAKILHLVEEAQETKTPTELFINKFAKYYTPLIMVISALVMIIPPVFLNGDWGQWFYQGLAVLIVGCPCALILSSPIAIVSGITRNARNGILIKGGVHLEQLGNINTLAFDKTGTLTKGQPHVEDMIQYTDNFLKIAGSIEQSSSHPLATAIMDKINEHAIEMVEPDDVVTISGQGIHAEIEGKTYRLGSEKVISHLSVIPEAVQQDIQRFKQNGLTVVLVADAQVILGLFGIADEVRAESKGVINALHDLGIENTVMLTGDHEQSAMKVSRKVGVSHVYAGLLPEEKVDKVKQLKEQGTVAMVGDGINDAPALVTSDLGIAMGKGTDSAIETADVVLMQDHLGKLPDAISISKRVNRVVKLNLSLALGLKVFALILTIPGWLTLWIAILADMGATVLVTLISLTVLYQKKSKVGDSDQTPSDDTVVQQMN